MPNYNNPNVAKYKLTASSPLRAYLWKQLQDELGWQASETGNLVPITIPQQQPEFNQYDAPYIVYRWSLMPSGEDFLMREEQVTFTVYSQEEEDIRLALIMMDAKLNRYDESAGKINHFLSTYSSAAYKNFDFKYTYTINVAGPQPAATEGGRMDGQIIVRLCYTVQDAATGLELRG